MQNKPPVLSAHPSTQKGDLRPLLRLLLEAAKARADRPVHVRTSQGQAAGVQIPAHKAAEKS